MQSNFIEITLQHGCSPVNLMYIFRTSFSKNTYGEQLVEYEKTWTRKTSNSDTFHAVDPFLLGSESKNDDINLQDAISDTKNNDQSVQEVLNNDDLKHAMTDSDLKGLSQIAKELDISDAKYFDQPMGNQRSLPQSTSTSSEYFITMVSGSCHKKMKNKIVFVLEKYFI